MRRITPRRVGIAFGAVLLAAGAYFAVVYLAVCEFARSVE